MTHEHVLQSPPCFSLTSQLLLQIIANSQSYFWSSMMQDRGDGGHWGHFYLGHTDACSVLVCIVTGMFQILKADKKHPNRHVTDFAVGSLLQEYISHGVPLWREMLGEKVHTLQVGNGLKSAHGWHRTMETMHIISFTYSKCKCNCFKQVIRCLPAEMTAFTSSL